MRYGFNIGTITPTTIYHTNIDDNSKFLPEPNKQSHNYLYYAVIKNSSLNFRTFVSCIQFLSFRAISTCKVQS